MLLSFYSGVDLFFGLGVGFDIFVKEIGRNNIIPMRLKSLKEVQNNGIEDEQAGGNHETQHAGENEDVYQKGAGSDDTWKEGQMVDDNVINQINLSALGVKETHDCVFKIQKGKALQMANAMVNQVINAKGSGCFTRPTEDDRAIANFIVNSGLGCNQDSCTQPIPIIGPKFSAD